MFYTSINQSGNWFEVLIVIEFQIVFHKLTILTLPGSPCGRTLKG